MKCMKPHGNLRNIKTIHTPRALRKCEDVCTKQGGGIHYGIKQPISFIALNSKQCKKKVSCQPAKFWYIINQKNINNAIALYILSRVAQFTLC